MKQIVYKYPLTRTYHEIEMHKGAKVLCVQTQRNEGCLWVLCDPIASVEIRKFIVIGTGQRVDEPIFLREYYIGTFQTDGGNYVFHVFEKM